MMTESYSSLRSTPPLFCAVLALFLSSCSVLETDSETAAKDKKAAVLAQYRPGGAMPDLPELKEGTPFEDYLKFALLNSPDVESSYYDWSSSVSSITVARSLPDPRVTFQMDIQRVIPSVMPGIAFDVPGPGKLRASAEIAAAESEAKYYVFIGKILSSAYDLEKACWELRFIDSKLKSLKASLSLLCEIEEQAQAANVSGNATIQDVLRAQIEQERLRTEIRNLEESREPALERFKASLGIDPSKATPPLPASIPDFPNGEALSERLLEQALAGNPQIQELKAGIKQAEAKISLAWKANIPDFTGGTELDALAVPILVRPSASMTLPIWRDKIAAGIEAAEAAKKAADARLSAGQIRLAVSCAEKRYLIREASRNLETLRAKLAPKGSQALEAARAGYSAGKSDFLTLLEAERLLLKFDVEEASAILQRDVSTAELALTLAGRLPESGAFAKPNVQNGK